MKHLISISLITVYSIALLHSVIPHYHLNEDFSMAEDHHDHDHHGHEHDQNATLIDDIIDFLNNFGHHDIGEDHLDNYVASTNSNASSLVDFLFKKVVLVDLITNTELFEQVQIVLFEHPPILYELLNSSSDPLRGPPSIA